MHELFGAYARRYDLHTPPGHYKHDHGFVLGEALAQSPRCRLLDVGCGTGVFMEAAIDAGVDAHGIDASPQMIDVARGRVDAARLRVQRMQDLADEQAYDLICALSWTIHYCETAAEVADVVARCRRALVPGGKLVLQVANDEMMRGAVNVDVEPGPSGEAEDTFFIHRFEALGDAEHGFVADYVYASRACGELLVDRHQLRFGNAALIADVLRGAGFMDVRGEGAGSISPFVIARVE